MSTAAASVRPDDASPVRRGQRVVIIGGGPAGYEAALVASQLGAQVKLVEDRGLGGSAVLTDVVPSKTLVAAAEALDASATGPHGVNHPSQLSRPHRPDQPDQRGRTNQPDRTDQHDRHDRTDQHDRTDRPDELDRSDGPDQRGRCRRPDAVELNARVRRLAAEQSRDLAALMADRGVEVLGGRARLGGLDETGTRTVHVDPVTGPWLGAPTATDHPQDEGLEDEGLGNEDLEDEGLGDEDLEAETSATPAGPNAARLSQDLHADVVLVATGARPRRLPRAEPDGRRILTWTQLYDLDELPEHLIVVGSGVTGAEFAGAYLALGSRVTLVSSRERLLPTVDADAADLVDTRFRARGMQVLSGARAVAAHVVRDDGDAGPEGEYVEVELADGRVVYGSHCLMAVGAVPATDSLGLEEAGVELTGSGHVKVDRVSRTTAYRVYAAGDCTGVLPLASVAAMQGRIAMRHALGDAVAPLEVGTVAHAVFTVPEIASIGIGEKEAEAYDAVSTTVPLARNPRAKMSGVNEGFVKLFSRRRSGEVLGGVIVGRAASEQVLAVTLAVTHRMTVEQVMNAFSVYPSLSGTITEAARQLHVR